MTKFRMKCVCGDTMDIDAESRDDAVAQFKGMMNEKGIAEHMQAKHPGEPLIPVAECHAMIERDVIAV